MVGVEQVGNRIENISEIFLDNTAGTFQIGTISDDVIQVDAMLEAGTDRSKVQLTITHDGAAVNLDVNLIPPIIDFLTLFTGAAFNGDNIEISYTVGAIGNDVIMRGTVTRYRST